MKYFSLVFLILCSCQYLSQHPEAEREIETIAEDAVEEIAKAVVEKETK